MPKVSVIVPTMRVGGFDVLFDGLENQTFKDFELIISDGIHKYRKSIVEEKMGNYKFPIKHIEPIQNSFPMNSYCRYANSGIAVAEGEIVLFLVDYTWLPPECICKHVDLHDLDKSGKTFVMSPHVSLQHPPLKREINYKDSPENYTFEGIDRYANDVASNKLDDVMWNIFSDFKNPLSYPEETRFGRDGKIDLPFGLADHLLFYARNESVRLEHVLSVNGFDEDLDGSHGYQDSDLADRIHNLGVKFINNPFNPNYIINPRPIFPHGRRIRSIESNGEIWKSKRSTGFGRVNSILNTRSTP